MPLAQNEWPILRSSQHTLNDPIKDRSDFVFSSKSTVLKFKVRFIFCQHASMVVDMVTML